jgi:uncharacterized protein YjiS (DUF1127 family)
MKGIHAVLEPFGYSTFPAPHTGGAERGPGVGRMVETIKRRRRANRIIRVLSALSDDTLKDIGIERSNIPMIAESLLDIPELPVRAARLADRGHGRQLNSSAAAQAGIFT